MTLSLRKAHIYFLHVIVFCLLSSNAFGSGDKLMLESSGNSPTFLELYTSQGCYSCPPAEAWINDFKTHKGLWTDLIPINLHIDYWDYLGWKDPFAFAEFSTRQRMYKRHRHTGNVATPGFVVNGKGWNGWFRGNQVPETELENSGKLSADINGSDIEINFLPQQDGYKSLYAHVAILGFDIETNVPKGENAGKKLKHDFVVVGYTRSKMEQLGAQWQKWIYRPHTVNVDMSRQALVIWITAKDDPKPLQAVGSWL